VPIIDIVYGKRINVPNGGDMNNIFGVMLFFTVFLCEKIEKKERKKKKHSNHLGEKGERERGKGCGMCGV